METGEDVAIVLNKGNLLYDNIDLVTLKKTFQIIGKNELATKLGIYIAAG